MNRFAYLLIAISMVFLVSTSVFADDKPLPTPDRWYEDISSEVRSQYLAMDFSGA